MHEPRVADKNTPYWWEEAAVKPLPQQPLAKKLDVAIVGADYAGCQPGWCWRGRGVRLQPSTR